jgi:hypothetical protein
VLEVSKINQRFLCHLKEPKIPSRASRSRSFLNNQRIFKIQSILASFIVNHVISINLITLVHTDALIPAVTTPSEIILYYHLNHSIWSLSDNKELSRWVLPGLHPVNHLETQRGSNVCIKLPRRRVQSALQINIKFPVESIITNIVLDIKVNGSEFIENSGSTISGTIRHQTRPSMMPLLGVVIHPFQLPAGWNLTRPNNFTWKQQFKQGWVY